MKEQLRLTLTRGDDAARLTVSEPEGKEILHLDMTREQAIILANSLLRLTDKDIPLI